MKIIIKRKFVNNVKSYLFIFFTLLPLFLVLIFLIDFSPVFFEYLFINKETAEYFTVKLPESKLLSNNTVENDRDGELRFESEKLPENVFVPSVPDESRVYYKVSETDASRKADKTGISVNDSTNSNTDLNEILNADFSPDFADYELFSGEPLVLIYHTHTSESFEETHRGFYYEDDVYRTDDKSKNVCAVGEALKSALEKNGITVIHDTTVHDSPAFNGAYSRSRETALSILEKYPQIKITIDLHRDAMITDEGLSYKPTATVDGKKAAQMMIIAGCDKDNELGYSNWLENLPFSLHVQKTAQEKYPTLMRPLMFCNRSYNMGLTNTSFLLEVGTQSNTLKEAVYSGTLMGNILSEIIISNLK